MIDRRELIGGIVAGLAAGADAKKKAPAPVKAECKICRYYGSSSQLCKRYPTYVKRLPEDWCGEWSNGVNVFSK